MYGNFIVQTYKRIRQFFVKNLPFIIKPNGLYTKKDVVNVLLRAEVENTFVASSARRLEGISDDTVFYHLNKMPLDEALDCFSKGIEYSFLKTRKANRIKGKVDIAIDVNEIPYYGEDNNVWVIGGKHKDGTNKFLKIISIHIVKDGKRYTLCVIPFHMFNLLVHLVEQLILTAKKYVKIKTVLLDRGFLSVDYINKLEELGMKYVIPIKRNDKTVRLMVECFLKDINRIQYTMQSGKKVATTDLVIYETKDDLVGFATNVQGEPEHIANLYRKRWGIETGYRMKNIFYGRTCSRKIQVRLMFILLSFMLYNCWISVNRKLNDIGEHITAGDMCILIVKFIENSVP